MFQVFSFVCLQVFHLNVVYVCNGFQMFLRCFHKCFQTLVSSVSSIFFCMLQLLYPDVLKVDQVLHIGCAWVAADGVGDV